MNRTGSIGSRVPPADTTTRTPVRSPAGPPSIAAAVPPASTQCVEHRGRRSPTARPAGPIRCRRRPADPSSGATTLTPRARRTARLCLDGRVLPHLGVHGRAHHHRGGGRHQRGGEEVVGEPAGVPGQQVGGGRRHHDQVGPLAQAGVGNGRGLVPQADLGRLRAQGVEGGLARRTGWPARSGPVPRGCRRRPADGRPRPPCRRRCRRTRRAPRRACLRPTVASSPAPRRRSRPRAHDHPAPRPTGPAG